MNIQIIGTGSTGNAYKIDDGETELLLDAGLPIKKIQEALNFRLTSLSGCLITHRHGDHSKAVKDLVKKGIEIYSNTDTLHHTGVLENHRAHAVENGNQFDVGTFKIMPFDAVHDVPCLGFIIYSMKTREKLLYLTDSMYSPVQVPGLTHMILEVNYISEIAQENVENGVIDRSYKNRVIQTHMGLSTAIDMLKIFDKSKLQEVYICHLSDNNSDEEGIKEAIMRATGVEVIIC